MTSLTLSIVIAALIALATPWVAAGDIVTRFPESPSVPSRERHFIALVVARSQAIEGAFGSLFEGANAPIRIRFVESTDPGYEENSVVTYDSEQRVLSFRRELLVKAAPELSLFVHYWSYYENTVVRDEFPVIEVVDDGLWNAHLQDAARKAGLSWPHQQCASLIIAERLPCEMLVVGAHENLHSRRGPLFNANRIDMIWPEDLRDFTRRRQRNDREYLEVRRLGGIQLIRPLILEFGAPRVLSYLARTPFIVENNNMKSSALQYQEQARVALTQPGSYRSAEIR